MIPSLSSSTENVICDPVLMEAMPSTSVTSRSQRYTLSFTVPHLTPPESILRPFDTPLINFREEEIKRDKKDYISPTPASPSSSNDIILTKGIAFIFI